MNRTPSHILVVDDDDRIRDLTRRFLSNLGYHVTAADSGLSAQKLLKQLVFDLIVLDVMMPGMDGFELLKHLRQTDPTTPVIMLTARGESGDRIEGLKLGADDYIPKPFEPEELALRIAAILRRVVVEEPIEEVEMSGLVFNIAREELKDGAKLVRLTDGETQLLKILAQNAGEPVSREALANGTSAGADRSVDVQITRLRRKIEPDPKEPIHIQTVRSIGYRLMPDA
ncbi:response regulator [Ponticaulis sp.]|uniref:response regulator n=1 Tax=Ponticaulis sp. TaxID=2020902 RepID=UPI000B6971AF|nr:response regulator [Ponticaulis sp.]MAI90488.1 DNA-binding response regulator [Ponticaulis sp.]OUY00183.1 MAG: DNA-binding response regulator [Hyphomonadaceae bacterium TMED5]|tara:strand:- start:112821 stop:113504 length:684 start_codon:yes stop_codon:yes gene_type:complete